MNILAKLWHTLRIRTIHYYYSSNGTRWLLSTMYKKLSCSSSKSSRVETSFCYFTIEKRKVDGSGIMYLYSATGNWLLLAPYNLVALFPHSSRQYICSRYLHLYLPLGEAHWWKSCLKILKWFIWLGIIYYLPPYFHVEYKNSIIQS